MSTTTSSCSTTTTTVLPCGGYSNGDNFTDQFNNCDNWSVYNYWGGTTYCNITFDGKITMRQDADPGYSNRRTIAGNLPDALPSNRVVISLKAYIDKYGALYDDYIEFMIRKPLCTLILQFHSSGIDTYDGSSYYTISGISATTDTWEEWTFDWHCAVPASSYVDIYKDGNLIKAGVDCSYTHSSVTEVIQLQARGYSSGTMVYYDWIAVGSACQDSIPFTTTSTTTTSSSTISTTSTFSTTSSTWSTTSSYTSTSTTASTVSTSTTSYSTTSTFSSTTTTGTTYPPSDYRAFVRFVNVTIPYLSKILKCELVLTAFSDKAGRDVNVRLHFVEQDNPTAPADGTELAGYDITPGELWMNLEDWRDGKVYTSPDFSGQLQRIVDRNGWESGNSVICIIDDHYSDTFREFSAYEWRDSIEKAALRVEWIPPNQVDDPTFTPPGQYFHDPLTIRIHTWPTDAIIYYTMDGSAPDENSTPYTTPIDLPAETDTTLKAKAYKERWLPSGISVAEYRYVQTAYSTDEGVIASTGVTWNTYTLDNPNPVDQEWYNFGDASSVISGLQGLNNAWNKPATYIGEVFVPYLKVNQGDTIIAANLGLYYAGNYGVSGGSRWSCYYHTDDPYEHTYLGAVVNTDVDDHINQNLYAAFRNVDDVGSMVGVQNGDCHKYFFNHTEFGSQYQVTSKVRATKHPIRRVPFREYVRYTEFRQGDVWTINVTQPLQEVINRPGWAKDNGIGLIIMYNYDTWYSPTSDPLNQYNYQVFSSVSGAPPTSNHCYLIQRFNHSWFGSWANDRYSAWYPVLHVISESGSATTSTTSSTTTTTV